MDATVPGTASLGDRRRGRADAVVIGSGAGGGPVAATLAEAGLHVVVVEAGPRLEVPHFTGEEGAMLAALWRLGLAPPRLALYAGACVGGSTVINDALCFPPPPEVLAAWRDEHGLGGLTEAAMAPFVARAWADLHASETDLAHTSRNAAALARGARRLGWAGSATPRSVRGCLNLGLCNLGCPSNAKQSTLVAYVPRAERAGATVLPRTRVERVRTAAGAVVGIAARTDAGETLAVDAPLVCVAAGVLETPALLQRSGIAAAGAGVAFHSSTHVTARFREPIHGYYGPTMGWAVHEWSDVNGHTGPGVMIENTGALPVAAAGALPRFGKRHAARMAQLPYLARALVVAHDRTRGRIDAAGGVAYDLQPEDLERLRAGIAAAARAYLAAGAEEVWLPVIGLSPVRMESDLRALERAALGPRDLALLYAVHLFGGAAMGRHGVAEEDGAVRGLRGLYVVDAAALPTNTGVNPQVTIVANALRIASGIAARGRIA